MKKRTIHGAAIHEIAGHTWYVIDPKYLPVTRMKAYVISLQEIDWGMTGEDLGAAIELCIEKVNSMDISKVGAILEMMKSYRENYIQPKVLWTLANNFILVDDEPLTEFSDKHTEMKGKLCELHESVSDFFFTQAMSLVISSAKPLTSSEIKGYLTDPVMLKSEETFLNISGKKRYSPKKRDITSRRTLWRTIVTRLRRRY